MTTPLLVLMLSTAALAADPSIVFIGDPHLDHLVFDPDTIWVDQTAWIRDHQSDWNIQAVLCAGDFGFAGHMARGWNQGWSVIDGMGIPYLSAVGNHDYENNNAPGPRDTTTFDAQIGYSRISGKSFFGGFWNDTSTKANQYILFDIGTRHFLAMALEIYPRPDAITWATGIVNANADKEIIVITHGYMNPDYAPGSLVGGTLTAYGDTFGPNFYGLPMGNYGGPELAAWANGFTNVHLIMAGHNGSPNYFHRLDGNVHGIMSDYQDDSPPSSYVTILSFNSNTVTVNNVNTTTGAIDMVNFPPSSFDWIPAAPESPTTAAVGWSVHI